jgi:hypothetical protein
LAFGQPASVQQWFGDTGRHGHARVQTGIGILEDDLHPFAQRPHCLPIQAADFAAAEADGTVGGPEQPNHQPGQGAFPAS